MVTPLQSIRQITSQYLLNAIKENEIQSQSGGSNARTALLKRYGINTSTTSSSQTGLATLLAALSAQSATPATTETDTDTPPAMSSDITTASFMTGLKQQLKDMSADQTTSKQADAMLAALKAGTLTVSDPVTGVSIKAWDVESAAEKATTQKTGTKIDSVGWSEFLKVHLQRGDSGGFSKTADGSYVDKVTAGNAYFGTAGAGYVYLSWPQAKAAA